MSAAALVGVTGQIGAGKSAVCAEFQRRGATVIDADAIGKDITGSPAVLKQLARHFGSKIQSKAGRLRPQVLGELVFSDPTGAALERLNVVVQPKLTAELRRQIRRYRKTNSDLPLILDAAILPQWDLIEDCDLVITVIATKEVRLKRLLKRGMKRKTALARMDGQLSQNEYIAAADIIIQNSSTERELLSRARRVWQKNLLQLS